MSTLSGSSATHLYPDSASEALQQSKPSFIDCYQGCTLCWCTTPKSYSKILLFYCRRLNWRQLEPFQPQSDFSRFQIFHFRLCRDISKDKKRCNVFCLSDTIHNCTYYSYTVKGKYSIWTQEIERCFVYQKGSFAYRNVEQQFKVPPFSSLWYCTPRSTFHGTCDQQGNTLGNPLLKIKDRIPFLSIHVTQRKSSATLSRRMNF